MEEPMAMEFSICEVRWERYRRVSENPQAREWLKFQAARGLAANTIEAYGRDLDCYLGFLETENIPFHSVIRPTIGAYIRSITPLIRNHALTQKGSHRIAVGGNDMPAAVVPAVSSSRQVKDVPQSQPGPSQVLHSYPFGKCVSINSDIFAR